MYSMANGTPRPRLSRRSSLASSVRLDGAFHVDRGIGTARGDEQRDEAAEARAEQADAAVEPGMAVEVGQDGPHVLDPRRDRRVVLAATRLAAATEVEARQREAGRRQLVAEEQILVGVLRRRQAVAREDAGNARGRVGQVQDE